MRRVLAAALAGAIFAAGLALSGMTDPARVLAFLNLAGDWDPRLAVVMAGALGVAAPARRWILGRGAPLFGARFPVSKRDIDGTLVVGAALFGMGWGLSGWCPGPALVSAGSGQVSALVFVAAMAAGMAGVEVVRRRAEPAAVDTKGASAEV